MSRNQVEASNERANDELFTSPDDGEQNDAVPHDNPNGDQLSPQVPLSDAALHSSENQHDSSRQEANNKHCYSSSSSPGFPKRIRNRCKKRKRVRVENEDLGVMPLDHSSPVPSGDNDIITYNSDIENDNPSGSQVCYFLACYMLVCCLF